MQPPGYALTIGGLLGCLGIPLYATGYLAVARMVRPHRPTSAKVVAAGGTAFALIGACIHGLTWMAIRSSVAAGVASASPLEAVAGSAGVLLDVWIVAAVLMLILALAVARAGLAVPRGMPVWLAMLNPVIVTLALGAAGRATLTGQAFVVPAAPNLAHIVFFAAALYVSAANVDLNAPPTPTSTSRSAASTVLDEHDFASAVVRALPGLPPRLEHRIRERLRRLAERRAQNRTWLDARPVSRMC